MYASFSKIGPSGIEWQRLLEIVKIRDFSLEWGTLRPSFHTKVSYFSDFQKLAIQFLTDRFWWNLACLLILDVLFLVMRQFHSLWSRLINLLELRSGYYNNGDLPSTLIGGSDSDGDGNDVDDGDGNGDDDDDDDDDDGGGDGDGDDVDDGDGDGDDDGDGDGDSDDDGDGDDDNDDGDDDVDGDDGDGGGDDCDGDDNDYYYQCYCFHRNCTWSWICTVTDTCEYLMGRAASPNHGRLSCSRTQSRLS